MKAKVVYIESNKARRINEILAAEREFKEQGNKSGHTPNFVGDYINSI